MVIYCLPIKSARETSSLTARQPAVMVRCQSLTDGLLFISRAHRSDGLFSLLLLWINTKEAENETIQKGQKDRCGTADSGCWQCLQNTASGMRPWLCRIFSATETGHLYFRSDRRIPYGRPFVYHGSFGGVSTV